MRDKPVTMLASVLTLILGLSFVQGAFAAVTFLGDWTDFGSQFQVTGPKTRAMGGQPVEWVGGAGPNHWHIVQEKGLDRLQVEQDLKSPRGGAVLRVEVRPGDYLGWSGERAEVSYMLNAAGKDYWVTAQSGHEVYGISVKLDPNWPSNDKRHENQWGIFLQLHSPNEYHSPPPFSLAVENEFHLYSLAGDLMANGQRRGNAFVPFSNGALKAGHWVEFLIDVVWAYDTRGSLTIYRKDDNDPGFAAVLTQSKQPTLQYDSQIPDSENTDPTRGTTYFHYWKLGFYRSISPGKISRLWLGPLVRGTSIEEVAAAAFGRP